MMSKPMTNQYGYSGWTFDISVAAYSRNKLTVTNSNPSSVTAKINLVFPGDQSDSNLYVILKSGTVKGSFTAGDYLPIASSTSYNLLLFN